MDKPGQDRRDDTGSPEGNPPPPTRAGSWSRAPALSPHLLNLSTACHLQRQDRPIVRFEVGDRGVGPEDVLGRDRGRTACLKVNP